MTELHTDVSSAASEIYTASVALNEFLHLAYITDKLRLEMPVLIHLECDNTTAILFSKGTTRPTAPKDFQVRKVVCVLAGPRFDVSKMAAAGARQSALQGTQTGNSGGGYPKRMSHGVG